MSRERLSLSSRWITGPAASRRLTVIPPPASSSPMFSRALSALRARARPWAAIGRARECDEPPNAHHIVSANGSKTQPAQLIAYIIADDGAEPTVYDK